jgi:DNA-binding IclR family transcriptional regulator
MGFINLDASAPRFVSINSQTGTTYTLAASDSQKLVSLDNASAVTVTVPPESSVNFAIGTQILLYQKGAGQVTVAAGSGVTVNSSDVATKTRLQYSVAGLMKVGSNSWLLFGDIEA